MGKATVDLPDPLDQTPGAANGADDLLSQLAGDEIDRLLAEAEVEKPEDAAAPVNESPAAVEPIAPPAEETASPIAASPTPDVPALPTESRSAEQKVAQEAEIEGQLSSQLDALFTELQETPADAGATPAAPAAPPTVAAETATHSEPAPASPANASPPITEQSVASPAAPIAEEETTHAERSGLTPTAGDVELSAAVNALHDPPAETPPSDALPLFLRPLEWINAPLAVLPEPIREALGKVAILTMINAIAVLAYVLLFRRH